MPTGPDRPLDRAGEVLVLLDGRAGNDRQALALGRALSTRPSVVQLAPRAPWRWLAPYRQPGDHHAFGAALRARLRAPWPALVIGCGRQAALATRLLRAASGGTCRSVQILDPRIASHRFDLVVAPQHDRLQADNVLTTLGALNPVDDDWLAVARQRFAFLEDLPQPRLAVLLGGPNRALRLDPAWWQAFAAALRQRLQQQGGSLMLSSSRRTPAWLKLAAREAFADVPGRQWHGPGDGENPYAGFLAWADQIAVTPDSVNMLSEAAATRVPVFTHVSRPLRGKLAQFVEALQRSGRLQPLDAVSSRDPQPLRETARVAAEIRRRFGWPG